MPIEERIALEAIKPASGFITALLAPKIEKVKAWAKEKDLQGFLGEETLAGIMEKYLISLAHRATQITSMTFPQLNMDIFEAYEPLHLTAIHDPKKIEIKLSSIIEGKFKALSIIDGAGMGKSTFSKYVVAKTLSESVRIPLLLELRKINTEVELVENLAKELDFPGNVFNRDLFYKLLSQGKFFVILDGFDEVSIDHQENLSNQIYDLSVKGGDNILVLTSRPQDKIPNFIEGKSLTFLPFTRTQSISLLKRYDNISKLNIGQKLISEIESVPQKFTESPLLISLLYRTYGVNNSIADRVCTFYNDIYHALYKGHDLINKNGFGREKKSNLDFEDFRKLLRALCYYTMLNRKSSYENWSTAISYIAKSEEISSITPSSTSNFLDDTLVSVPLTHKDGNEIKFFHKTLLEYFAAEYIVFDKSSSSLLKKLFESKLAESFGKTFDFLFEINPSLFENIITYHFADLASKISCGETHIEKLIKTLLFLSDCKFGIWEVNKYGAKIDNHQDKILKAKRPDNFNAATWEIVKVANKEYFLAITVKNIPRNLHPKAWECITDTISNLPKHFQSNITDFKKIKEIFEINRWHDFSEENTKSISISSSMASLIINAINLYLGEHHVRNRILSEEKIQLVLKKIERETEHTRELDMFFH